MNRALEAIVGMLFFSKLNGSEFHDQQLIDSEKASRLSSKDIESYIPVLAMSTPFPFVLSMSLLVVWWGRICITISIADELGTHMALELTKGRYLFTAVLDCSAHAQYKSRG